MGGPTPHVTFSAHGLPVSYIKSGDPYRDEIDATFRGILERLPERLDTSLCFQSRVGPAEWLRPYTEDHVADLARRGVKRLLMVPLAFVSDHIETLYEMDMLYGAEAVRLGMEFRRVPALNGSTILADALTQLVAERLEHAGVGFSS
jgi:ferrochelatase